MSEFGYAVTHTIEAEGVFSNHEHDPGGKTRYGITERLWIAFWADKYPGMPRPKIEQITVVHAVECYRDVFWDALRLDRIQDKHVAAEVFDSAVNCGARDAVEFLQRACNYCRIPASEPLKVDGALGPITRGRVQQLIDLGYRVPLLIAMNGEQYIHYKAQDNPHMSRGWTMRLKLAEEL